MYQSGTSRRFTALQQLGRRHYQEQIGVVRGKFSMDADFLGSFSQDRLGHGILRMQLRTRDAALRFGSAGPSLERSRAGPRR